jgi:hypothetical protein
METEFFGGLDADSYADPESLVRLMSYFEKDKMTWNEDFTAEKAVNVGEKIGQF